MKRRILALVLALVLACSMSTVALADSRDVTIQVIQEDVHSTKVDWGNFNFVYTFDSENGNKWNWTSADVTVTNNSTNTSINVSSEMENKGTVNGVTVSYTGDGTVKPLAANGGSTTYTVTVTGTPANQNVAQTVVGTITVTIS